MRTSSAAWVVTARNAAIACSSSGSISSTSDRRRAAPRSPGRRRRRAAPAARSAISPPKRCDVLSGCHRRLGPPAEAVDQVGQHGARLDGGELTGVADQHQPGVRTDRLEQAGHHRERDHRGLVDHDHVVRAAGWPGCAGTGCCCRAASRAAGAGSRTAGRRAGRGRPAGSFLVSSSTDCCSLADALPVGRSQRDPEVAAGADPSVLGLLGEQGEQAGDGGGLAGAGTAGQHGGPAPGGLPDGVALLLVPVLGEDPQHTGVEDLGVDLGRLPVEAATTSRQTCTSSRQ